MGRRSEAPKRRILPDPKYNDVVVAKFINTIMLDGRKSAAEHIFYSALDSLHEKTGEDPLRLFKKALENIKPVLECKSRRVGGANYQVPIEVKPHRRQSLAMRWIKDAARSRGEHSMVERLANEIVDAVNERGASIKKRDDVHKMAEANQAFAHFRW